MVNTYSNEGFELTPISGCSSLHFSIAFFLHSETTFIFTVYGQLQEYSEKETLASKSVTSGKHIEVPFAEKLSILR